MSGSKPGQTVMTENGAKIIGAGNLASQLATSASEMFSKNVQAVINDIADKDGNLNIDLTDDVMSQLVATDHGEIISDRLRDALNLPTKQPAEDAPEEATKETKDADKGDE